MGSRAKFKIWLFWKNRMFSRGSILTIFCHETTADANFRKTRLNNPIKKNVWRVSLEKRLIKRRVLNAKEDSILQPNGMGYFLDVLFVSSVTRIMGSVKLNPSPQENDFRKTTAGWDAIHAPSKNSIYPPKNGHFLAWNRRRANLNHLKYYHV